MIQRLSRGFGRAALLALAAVPAAATSYVPMSDEALVAQAPLAAVLRVGAVAPARTEAASDYTMTVERALKGSLPATALTVRVPGGVDSKGRALRIWGAPRFAPGERVLLFLSPRADGRYDLVHLMLGTFFEVRAGGRRFAVRDLSEVRRVELPGRRSEDEPLRDFARFADWVARRARGRKHAADYFVSDAARAPVRAAAEPYTLIEYLRWFEFDAAVAVSWLAHQEGQEGVAGGGFAEFQTALEAWNADADTNIGYAYAGTTASEAGFDRFDGVNAILFNRNIGSPFSCESGGVLAMGGPWFDAHLWQDYRGLPFYVILGADIVTNDGTECYFQGDPKAAEEVFAHELGHTLGLSHSCDENGFTRAPSCSTSATLDAALMRWAIHDDGRGASLESDDRAGIKALYRTSSAYSFYTLSPCRLLDTRDPEGSTFGQPLETGVIWNFEASGCGIPQGVRALSTNVTVVDPGGAGHLTFYPFGLAPATSTINFAAAQTRANNAIVVLSFVGPSSFRVLPHVLGSGTVHVVVDVNGWFD